MGRQLERIRPAKRQRELNRSLAAFREAVEKVLPIVQTAAAFNDPVPLPEAVKSLMRFVIRATGAADGALIVRHSTADGDESTAAYDAEWPIAADSRRFPSAASLAASAVSFQEPVALNDFDSQIARAGGTVAVRGGANVTPGRTAARRDRTVGSARTLRQARTRVHRRRSRGWSRPRRRLGPICFARRSRSGRPTGCSSTRSKRRCRRPTGVTELLHGSVRGPAAGRDRTVEGRAWPRTRTPSPMPIPRCGWSRPCGPRGPARPRGGRTLREGRQRPPQAARYGDGFRCEAVTVLDTHPPLHPS